MIGHAIKIGLGALLIWCGIHGFFVIPKTEINLVIAIVMCVAGLVFLIWGLISIMFKPTILEKPV